MYVCMYVCIATSSEDGLAGAISGNSSSSSSSSASFSEAVNIVNTFFFLKIKKSVHDCRPNLSQESYRHRLHRLLRALRRFLSPAQRIADLADDLCWAPMSEYDRTFNVIIHTYIQTRHQCYYM